MFGVLRFILALMVFASHSLALNSLGRYAVFGFYVISGYLITLVMQKKYGYHPRGTLRFALNRIIRLYPLYWIATGVSLLIILGFGPDRVAACNPAVNLPDSPLNLLQNISMIFCHIAPSTVLPKLVSPVWVITVEIAFYALIALGLSKTPRRVYLALAASLLFYIITAFLGMPWETRYFTFPAAALPYTLGCLLYFITARGNLRVRIPSVAPLLLLAALFLNIFVAHILMYTLSCPLIGEIGSYLNLALIVCLVYALITSPPGFIFIPKRLDDALGALSYPLYLLHESAIILTTLLLFDQPYPTFQASMALFCLPLVPLLAISFLLVKTVDNPLQHLRTRIAAAKIPAEGGKVY